MKNNESINKQEERFCLLCSVVLKKNMGGVIMQEMILKNGIVCRNCSSAIAKNAKPCPFCGELQPKKMIVMLKDSCQFFCFVFCLLCFIKISLPFFYGKGIITEEFILFDMFHFFYVQTYKTLFFISLLPFVYYLTPRTKNSENENK